MTTFCITFYESYLSMMLPSKTYTKPPMTLKIKQKQGMTCAAHLGDLASNEGLTL